MHSQTVAVVKSNKMTVFPPARHLLKAMVESKEDCRSAASFISWAADADSECAVVASHAKAPEQTGFLSTVVPVHNSPSY